MCRWELIEFTFCSLFTVFLCILSEKYEIIAKLADVTSSKGACADINKQQVIIRDEATYKEVETYLQSVNPSNDMWVGMYWDDINQLFRWSDNDAKVAESIKWCAEMSSTSGMKYCVQLAIDQTYLCFKTSVCERSTKCYSLCQARNFNSQTEAGEAIGNTHETTTPCPICDATTDHLVTCEPCPTCDVTTNQHVTCQPCPTCDVTTNQHVTCQPCPTCKATTNQQVTCEPCPTCDITTNQHVTCEPCPTSDFTTNQHVTCQPCPTCEATTNQHITCQPCPICDATTNQHVTCEPCPTNDVTTNQHVTCEPCPTSDIITNQHLTCEPCPTGDVTTNQHVTCEPCPTSDVTTSQHVTCEPCPTCDVTTSQHVTCEPCPTCDVTTNQNVTCEPCPSSGITTNQNSNSIDTTTKTILNQSTTASKFFNQTAFQESLYKVKKEETGSYRRRNTSAYDGRFSSKVIGVTGVIILVIVCCIFPALDMINLAQTKHTGKKTQK